MQESPDLLTEEDYISLKGLGPSGTQLDLYESDDSTVDEFPEEEDPVFRVKLAGTDKVAIIDAADKWRVEYTNWMLSQKGYAIDIDNKTFLHHVIKGVPETGLVIDHINTNKLDNRSENLRIITRSQNVRNHSRKKTPPKGRDISKYRSGFPGISYYPQCDKFVARIQIDGKRKLLGCFEEEHLAAFVFAVETLRIDPLIWYREWDEFDIESL